MSPIRERLQKILSQSGVCSRRRAEDYLRAGRVTVNGSPAALGDKADPDTDDIAVDGAFIRPVGAHTYLMLHKPRGVVSTRSDERGRTTVAALVAACGVRVWPVGRLDYDSEGLLLMTDDGDMTNRLTHPRHEIEKEYHVYVAGDVAAALPVLRGEMTLDGVLLRPAVVACLAPALLSITIREGKNRQVRRMCAAAGLTVLRLIRVREGTLHLGTLAPGAWRALTAEEINALCGASG